MRRQSGIKGGCPVPAQVKPTATQESDRDSDLACERGLFGLAVAWGAIGALVAQLSAPASYAWPNRTLSELAAPGHSLAWLMRLGMAGFGMMLGCALLLRRRRRACTGSCALVAVYAAGIVLCAVYPTRPFCPAATFEPQHVVIHGAAATLAFGAVALAALGRLIGDPGGPSGAAHTLASLLIVALSVGYMLAARGWLPAGQGMIQRALQSVASAWILYTYAGPTS
jgi:hypothetical membrane protein